MMVDINFFLLFYLVVHLTLAYVVQDDEWLQCGDDKWWTQWIQCGVPWSQRKYCSIFTSVQYAFHSRWWNSNYSFVGVYEHYWIANEQFSKLAGSLKPILLSCLESPENLSLKWVVSTAFLCNLWTLDAVYCFT